MSLQRAFSGVSLAVLCQLFCMRSTPSALWLLSAPVERWDNTKRKEEERGGENGGRGGGAGYREMALNPGSAKPTEVIFGVSGFPI